MRKMLVVAVIAGVACREPAPQTPVSTGAVEHKAPSPVGRIKVVEAPRTDPRRDPERTYGPVIASGIEAGRPWSMRGSIGPGGAASLVETGSGGAGGQGALPFQDLGWKKLGHFGTYGSGEHSGTGGTRTLTLAGVVSKQVAAIEARLADGTSLPVQIIDTGDPRANFFVAVWSGPSHWEVMIARDATGAELETCRSLPVPATAAPATATQATPTQGSTNRVTATRASATSPL